MLQALVHALPELLPVIQTHLLDLLSLGLTRKPYRENLSTAASHSLTQAIQLGTVTSLCMDTQGKDKAIGSQPHCILTAVTPLKHNLM